ncbi:MAG: hypothetical protein ACTSR8_12440 [Promethearchaeota archaeon]
MRFTTIKAMDYFFFLEESGRALQRGAIPRLPRLHPCPSRGGSEMYVGRELRVVQRHVSDASKSEFMVT